MVYYKLVKVKIDIPDLAKFIIVVVINHHSLCNSIIIDQSSVFT